MSMPPPAAPSAEEFDIPVSDTIGTPPVATPETPAAAPSPPEPVPVDERPRNPDGTFAKSAPVHAPEVIRAARTFGFSDEEIAETPANSLYRQVIRLHQEREQAYRALATEQDLTRRDASVQSGAASTPLPAVTEVPDEDYIEQFANETGFDKRFAGLVKKLLAENKKLSETVGALSKREQIRDQVATSNVLDRAFGSLKGYEKQLGKEAMENLVKDSPEAKRRIGLLRAAGINPANAGQIPEAQITKALSDAAALMLGPVTTDPYVEAMKPGAPAKPAANGQPPQGRFTQKEWDDAGLAVPTSRGADDLPPGEEKAIRNLAKKLGQEAVVPTLVNKDVYDGLL